MISRLASCVATLVFAVTVGAQPLANLSQQWVSTGGVAFVQDPLNPDVQYLVHRGGSVMVIYEGALIEPPFATLVSTGGQSIISFPTEGGLLGMAFASDYATSHHMFFFFTSNGRDANSAMTIPYGAIVVARYTTTQANPPRFDRSTRFDLALTSTSARYIEHALSTHYGGTLNVGPDGYLYVGIGDGASPGGAPNPAQNPNSLLGKVLRLDVNVSNQDPEGFDIPPSNPFLPANNPPIAANPLIWAFGLRNPWKHSFDDYGHGRAEAFIIGDVGQTHMEEINYQPPGVGGFNYGWNRYEGSTLQYPAALLAYDLGPGSNYRYVAPAHAYTRESGECVIGGYVYRGHAMCSYKGRYFFADLENRVWSMRLDDGVASDLREHPSLEDGYGIVGFGRDAAGELYILRETRLMRIISDDPPMIGDADGDRDVDFVDLNAVLSDYGESGPAGGARPLAGDVNDDGAVDFIDLNIVLGSYGSVC